MMELATLRVSEVCLEMMAREISLVGRGTARGLGHRHDIARVVQARLPLAGTAVAGLATLPCGTAAEAAGLETQLFAGAGTGMGKAEQATVPGRKSHVWTAVLAIWSAIAELATALCRRLDTAAWAELGTLLGDGTAAAGALGRWLAGGTAVVEVPARRLSAGIAVAEVLGTRLSADIAVDEVLASRPAWMVVVQATRLSRRGSGTAVAGANWCGRASRVC
jgi:hypothetical protein